MKWTPELKHDAVRMREEGLTVPQIAERIGVQPQSVYDLFKRMNKAAKPKQGGETPKMEAKKPPEPKPKKEVKLDPVLEELIFNAFNLTVSRCRDLDLPIECHWRSVIHRLEEQLSGMAAMAREHPDAAEYIATVVAIVASDELQEKEMAPPDGDPSETNE